MTRSRPPATPRRTTSPATCRLSSSEVPVATTEEGLVRLYVDRGELAMPQLLRILDGEGLTADSISIHRPSLDDVFLRQTGRSLRDEAAA